MTNTEHIQDVAPAFRVKYIIRHIDKECADDIEIEVNDHNRRQFSFIISTASFYDNNVSIKKIFSNNKLVLTTFLGDRIICEHLIYDYELCMQNQLIYYTYDVIGWYMYEKKEYFLYDNTIFADGSQGFSSRKISFCKGDKAIYEKFLQDVVYKRKELSLAMAIGYSAVITAKLKDVLDVGTIIVNLCGASSTGKSTAEMLMVSPFACPEISNRNKGLAFTAHSTQNALFSRINGLYGVPFVIDDIITNPYLDYSNLVYTISTCEEKSRCHSDGSVKESNFGWNGVAITSSELPITEYTKQDMGIKARVLLTQGITWTESAEQAEQIKRTILQNYGFTGKEFAYYIGSLSNDDIMKKFFESKECVNSAMSKRDNLTDRIANKIAVIHLTVKLMNACFGLALNSDDITDLLIACDQNCVDERDPAKKALECIESFIYEKYTHFNIYYNCTIGYKHPLEFPSGDKYGKIEVNEETQTAVLYILASKTEQILLNNKINEIATVRKRWAERGISIIEKDHYTKKVIIGENRVRCDCIKIPFHVGKLIPDMPMQPTPVCDIEYDDSEAIGGLFDNE